MHFSSRGEVLQIRRTYPQGTRIELVFMNDPYSKLIPGSLGTVAFTDDAGSVHIHWDNGENLAVILGEDVIKPV